MKVSTYIYVTLMTLMISQVFGQRSQANFGKNRVQYEDFKWLNISTRHFNIYYYAGANDVAHNTARYAEKDYNEITDVLGYIPMSKTNIIVYNSVSDLQQSNIGLNKRQLVSGETELIKSKIEIAFTGSYSELRREIKEKVSELYINLMLFGGNFKDMVQSSYLMEVSAWYTLGAAAYVSDGWTPEMEDKVNDLVLEAHKNPDQLSGKEAKLVGQSIWNYIESEYGKSSIASILNLTRVVRDERTSISNTLGVPFEVFLQEWREFYAQTLVENYDDRVELDKSGRIRKINLRKMRYESAVFNPDSTLVAYGENHKGRFRVFVYDPVEDKRKRIKAGGHKVVNQTINYKFPQVAWRSPDELSIAYMKRGKPFLYTENIRNGDKERKYFNSFDEILSIDYHQQKDEMVLSAIDGGRSDIFIYDYKKNYAKRITKDLYDDHHPKYVPGTNSIIFSSNRPGDTLGVFGKIEQLQANYDIFLYNIDDDSDVLERLTNSEASETHPHVIDQEEIYFLSDVKSGRQIYKLNRNESKAVELTNFDKEISAFGVHDDYIAFSAVTKGRPYLYRYHRDSLKGPYHEYTAFRKTPSADTGSANNLDSLKLLKELLKINVDLVHFESSDSTAVKLQQYEMEDIHKKLSDQEQGNEETTIYGPYKYKGMLSADRVLTTPYIDPLLMSGILAQVSLSDFFNDHYMNVNYFLSSNTKSSNLSAEYSLLKYRRDYSFQYDRRSLFLTDDNVIHRLTSNTFTGSVSHPFTQLHRITLSGMYVQTRFIDHFNVFREDVLNGYAAGRVEYVFDNTEITGMNMIKGTRVKANVTHYQHLADNAGEAENHFGRMIVDARHYQELFRDVVFAGRASGGAFFGADPKNFLIGGVDNWLFQETQNHGEGPLALNQFQGNENMLFMDYVTNLRGFNLNQQYGQRYLLLNLEVRIPVAKTLYNGPVNSSFMHNLQLNGFYDIGTAWTGRSPFGQNNTFNTTYVEVGGPFTADVTNYRNPFLSSFGVGLRSTVVGYYLKADLAWGIYNYVLQPPMLHLSIGADF